MEKVTFMDSIIKILNLIASVPFFIEILILTIILLIAMIFFYFRKSKKGKVTSLIIYFVTLLLLPISHLSFFATTIDKIIENFIKILYFPSCYIYMAMLIFTDITVFIRIIKNIKSENRKWYSMLDIIYFFVFQFLFFLIVRLVISNKIDVFERTELYSNESLTSVLQISSYIFWIRIGLILISLIVNALSKNTTIKEEKDNKITNNTSNISPISKNSNDKYEKEIIHEVDIDNNHNKLNNKEIPKAIIENNKFVLNKENISNVSNINDITSMINSKSNINNNSLNQHINNKPNITLDSLPVIELDTKDNKNSNLNLDDEDDNDNYFDDFYE